jgi:hypothetical protein
MMKGEKRREEEEEEEEEEERGSGRKPKSAKRTWDLTSDNSIYSHIF